MKDEEFDAHRALEHALLTEWPRLVRLCAWLSGDWNAAEDLAQETSLQAWKLADRLRDVTSYQPWLSAIARHVCLHWTRDQYHNRKYFAMTAADDLGSTYSSHDDNGDNAIESVPDAFDFEAELERLELEALLDRALSLLPPLTRLVLVSHYIEQQRQIEIAARLGLSPGAVMVRLHRGRRALRQVLASELRAEASESSLTPSLNGGWEETRVWCVSCGQRHLMGRFDPAAPELTLRCPDCYARSGAVFAQSVWPEALKGARGYKSALSRLQRSVERYYRKALSGDAVRCVACGGPASIRMGMPSTVPPGMRDLAGAYVVCKACGSTNNVSLEGLILASLDVRRFWRAYPRLRILTPREIAEVNGHPALLIRFECVSASAGLDVIVSRDNFRILQVHRSPRA